MSTDVVDVEPVRVPTKLQELHDKATELYNDAVAKGDAYRIARDQYRIRQNELRKVYDLYIEDALRREFPHLDTIREASDKAQAEHQRAVEAKELYKAMERLPYPEGTVLVQWSKPYSHTGIPYPHKLTGNKGVLQIYKHGDDVPDNLRGMRLPWAGMLIVRLQKKDGTLGKKFESYGNTYDCIWVPEGVDPNKKEENKS